MFKYHSAVLKNVNLSSYAQQSLKIELRVVVGTTLKYVFKSCMEFRRKLNKNGPQGESVIKIYDSVYDMCHETVACGGVKAI